MPAGEIDRADLHADSETIGPAVTGIVHGTAPEPGINLPRQHEEDWSAAQEQFHHQYQRQPDQVGET